MIGRADIEAARDRIEGRVRRTPVVRLEPGVLGVEAGLDLKLEHLQRTGSFKARGAFNSLLSSPPGPAGVVAVSGGNHGAAVALAASELGHKSLVFVPKVISKEVKLARMRHYGAEVRVTEGTVDQCLRQYQAYADETGALAVHPYGSVGTLCGQGTVGAEFDEQVAGLDTLFVSVGGGGLIGGIAAWFGGRVKIVAVETEGTASLDLTLKGNLPADFAVSGISASGLGASTIGDLPIEIIRAHVAANLVVTDADVFEAQRRLWEAARILAEPGGVTALAALTSGAYQPQRGERIGVLICGGNAEPNWFELAQAAHVEA